MSFRGWLWCLTGVLNEVQRSIFSAVSRGSGFECSSSWRLECFKDFDDNKVKLESGLGYEK